MRTRSGSAKERQPGRVAQHLEQSMISTVCLNTNSKTFTENCIAVDISELRQVEGNIIWADVSDPTSRDFEELAEEFGFHHLSIEDCQTAHQRPKVEEYTGYYWRTFLGMEPVVLVILLVMLAFIGFIAWQISLMPAK